MTIRVCDTTQKFNYSTFYFKSEWLIMENKSTFKWTSYRPQMSSWCVKNEILIWIWNTSLIRELLSISTERNSTILKLKCSTDKRKSVSYSDKRNENVHNINGTISPIKPHSCKYMECNEGTDNTNQGKHAHQVTLPTYIKLRKFNKITYISNWLDFFGRSNLELTKKRNFTRVSGRRKRCKLSTFVWRHERYDSEISNLHVFSR